jgi:hypothetical protein
VTGFAIRIQRLVDYVTVVCRLRRLVTAEAGSFCVRAGQRKTRVTIVIKLQLLPSGSGVTAVTVRDLFTLIRAKELSVVNVFVAARAIHGKRLDPDQFRGRALVLNLVALKADNLAVLSFQRKARQFVVKGRAMPGVGVVTEFAAALCDPDVELPFVRIGMATLARHVRVLVSGIVLSGRLGVTRHARDRQMAARQRIAILRMFRDSKLRRRITVEGVTSFAGSLIDAIGKLPAMFILVAVLAGCKRQMDCHVAAGMALAAGHKLVLSFQRILGLGVIEAVAHDVMETGGGVTRFAVHSEFPFMHVTVAGSAVGKGQSGILGELPHISFLRQFVRRGSRRLPGMALVAAYLLVLAGQRIIRHRVRETRRGLPGVELVAGLAIPLDLAGMLVFVTRRAARTQAEVGLSDVDVRIVPDVLIGHEPASMTSGAFFSVMSAGQLKTSQAVIEILFAVGPVRGFKVQPGVLGMTGAALGVPHFCRSVKALLRSHFRADDRMTIDALGIGDFLPQFMTAGAVGQTFQLFVVVRQLARRNLRRGRKGQSQNQNDEQCGNALSHVTPVRICESLRCRSS